MRSRPQIRLVSAKKNILDLLESRMGYVAPNLSAIVGSAVAAKLIDTAGGLSALAKIPACNVLLLGAKKENFSGFSSQFRDGCYLEQTEIYQTTPPSFQMRACRLLASKSSLAVRVDSNRGDSTGKIGRDFCADMQKKKEKWQEPHPAKQPKPLPVPNSEPKKKRGGLRFGVWNDTHARMQFGVAEMEEGYGMLGKVGVSIRLAAKVANKNDMFFGFKERNKETSFGTCKSGVFKSSGETFWWDSE